jgi:eukaryotic-like serine/threonine-protein kinase
MGEVRAGWDKVLDRPVAVKVLREDAASDPAVRRRFEAEARAAARLVHPNLVQVYDSGEDGGIPFMVMERLPGHSLRDEIGKRKLAVPEAGDIALQVLAGLDAAHDSGLLHRDIKPANILCSSRGQWKVADFGIAKSVQPSGDDTITGVVLGTPAYLPPERLLGGEATPGGDLYALGVILYEALAGEKPYQATDPAGWVSATAAGPTALNQVRPDVPPALAAAIGRSMSRDPGQRFKHAREMAAAIQAALSGGSHEPTGWMAIPPATPFDDGATEVLPAGDVRRHRRFRPAGLAAVLAVLVAASIALAATEAGGNAPTPPTPTTVQATTTIAPPTTLPVVSTPPGQDHQNGKGGGGGGGGDQGDHGG